MNPDSLGFLYPSVDEHRCIQCGRCVKVCPFANPSIISSPIPRTYASRHVDINEVQTSRSGATFIALSDKILKRGGVVYGAGYGSQFSVKHKRVTSVTELRELKGSKYAQSDLRGILECVLDDLKNNMIVGFSGTPCQIASVRSFIPQRYHSKLYLIDIVCHGVASPSIWTEYLKYMEKRFRGSIEKVNFRDKRLFGWEEHRESFVVNGKSKTCSYRYYQSIYFRPSCSNCKYANLQRSSDITLADFWGIENVAPEFNEDNLGCNLLLVNTDKGAKWLDCASADLMLKQVDIEKSLQYNLQYPTPQHCMYDRFKSDYESNGFMYVMKKYCGWGLKNRIVFFVKKVLNKLSIRFGVS